METKMTPLITPLFIKDEEAHDLSLARKGGPYVLDETIEGRKKERK